MSLPILGIERSHPILGIERSHLRWSCLLRPLLALGLLCSSAIVCAQQEVPEVISPLRMDTDRNGVNLLTGKIEIPVPLLAVPAAPHLRFDRAQNAAPYFVGKLSDAGGLMQASYSIHTGTGTSESFRCLDYDCTSLTANGSSFDSVTRENHQGGSGARIDFTLHQVTVGSNPVTVIYYGSSVHYPNGEVLSYSYDTATLAGDPSNRIYYRPTRISSNLGYFISISYHPGALGTGPWGAPAQAALFKSSAPTVPLGKLSYSVDGKTITDIGGRVFTCEGCQNNALGVNLEQSAGSLQLPGEATPTLQVVARSGEEVVGSVTRDGVAWSYTYTNLRRGVPANSYLYDRVRVTGPNDYDTAYETVGLDNRNVIDRITDSIGRSTAFDFDYAFRLTHIVYPEGNEVRLVYDSFGNITSRTATPKPGSGLGSVTDTAQYPISSCNSGTFDVLCNRPTWYRDGLGRQTDFAYNAAGQLTLRTDPPDADGVRRKTIIQYTTSGGLSRRSVVRVCGTGAACDTGEEIRTEYEYFGNTLLPAIERRIDAARGETLETQYEYDDAGRLRVEDGPLPGTGDARYFRYDEHGRRTWEIGPLEGTGLRLARSTHYRPADDKVDYVDEGTMTSPADSGLLSFRHTTHGYDAQRNPVTEAVAADGATQTLVQRSFDGQGRLECEARRMNPDVFGSPSGDACTLGSEGGFGPDRVMRNVYDAAGQLLQVQRAVGTPLQQNYATYTYSANGKRRTLLDANDNLSTLEYDGFDRLQKLRFPVATPGAAQSSTTDYEQYGYDALGNRTSLRKRDGRTITYTFDDLNRLRVKIVPASVSGAPGYSMYSGYEVRGLLTHARFGSDSGQGISNGYDGFSRLRTSSSDMGGTVRSVASDYDVRGNRTRLTHPDGKFFEYVYDSADRLIHLAENGPSTTLGSLFYDVLGQRERLDRDVSGAVTGYAHDSIARLTGLAHDLDGTTTANDAAFGFAYNPASQVITRTLSNASYEFPLTPTVTSYTVNGRNQYTQVGGTNQGFDPNGNLTSDGTTTFGYDTENRLTSASGPKSATLKYDPLGRLWEATTSAGVTRFVYDGDRLIAEYNGSGTLQRRYVHGAGVDEPLVWYEGSAVSASSRKYLHADHQGSIVAVSNASGVMQQKHAYDPYGITGSSNTLRFQYTGQAAIPEIGLLYYKARFYNPALGRFMQTDPIGYEDDTNLYAYVRNDPLNNVDPTGNCPNCAAGLFAGGMAFLIGSAINATVQYAAIGEVDLSDALSAGASAGAAAAAIGFNPALAANPAAIAAIASVANVAGSAAADLANGESVSSAKAGVAAIAGATAGPAGSSVGRAIAPSIGKDGGKVGGEVAGAAAGEAIAAGLTVGGEAAVKGAENLRDAASRTAAEINRAAREIVDPNRAKYR